MLRSPASSLFLCFGVLAITIPAHAQERPIRIAVLNFGTAATSSRVATKIREALRYNAITNDVTKTFEIIDSDQARVAALGVGWQGSLNLTVQEARDLGAAIGADFYFIGDAQTVRRLPSSGAAYFESYASIFLVSARTGLLVHWDSSSARNDSPEAAEKDLLRILPREVYFVEIPRALERERAEREAAIEAPVPVIEVMSDEDDGTKKDVRAPRPYRRLKPEYPRSAAIAEVEATVDVLADIDARGEVGRVQIARWAGYGLDQSVIQTVKQMHFFPAMREGVAIPMRVLLRYNFRKPPK